MLYRHPPFAHTHQWKPTSTIISLAGWPRDVGKRLATDSLSGFNSTLIAFGERGSGKTFTMIGSEETVGLVPWVCGSIVDTIDLISPETGLSLMDSGTMTQQLPTLTRSQLNLVDAECFMSCCEIHSERVHDMLSQSIYSPSSVSDSDRPGSKPGSGNSATR